MPLLLLDFRYFNTVMHRLNMKALDKNTNRRKYLCGSAAAALAGSAAARSYQWRQRTKRGIVCILAPGLRHDAMGCAGHPLLKTPRIDRIRDDGILFQNAFCTTSLATPSLESFLSGAYPHEHGIINDRSQTPGRGKPPLLLKLLQEMDFKTAVVRADTNEPFSQQAIDRLTGQAGEFMRSARRGSFCLFVELPEIEPPVIPPPRFAGLFGNAVLPQPASWHDSFEGKPAWQRRKNPWIIRNNDEPVSRKSDKPWDPGNKTVLDYLRAAASIDEAVGRIFQTLEITGQLESTLVIFAGSHGCLLGEHRLTGGRYAYEESIRIPMLFRFPGAALKGGTVKEPVLGIDVAPTLLRWLWAENPNPFQGESLMPLLLGEDTVWRTSFLYEYWMAGSPVVPNMAAVRTDRYKLVHYPGLKDLDELYDLHNDPHELHNVIADPSYTADRTAVQNEFDRLRKSTGYKQVDPPPRTAPATRQLPRGLLINYTFDRVRNGIIANKALYPINAPLGALRPTEGERGTALRIENKQYLEIPRSSLLDLSVGPWAVNIIFKADSDGVVLSHGSATNHYAIFIENGTPCVSLRKGRATVVLGSRKNCIGQWINMRLNLNPDSASLTIDSERIDQIDIPDLLSEPHFTIRIGANPDIYGDPAIMKGDLPALATGFTGAVDSLKIIRQ